MKFDVLVVGEGLAALSMILSMPETAKIGVISKNKFNELSSYWAQGGISAVYSSEDNFDKHVKDTLIAGDGLCNEDAVRKIVGEGTSVLEWLVELGVPFTQENNLIHLTREGGHSERRVAHVDDMTGRGIMQVLLAKVALMPNVVWIRQHEALELISDGNAVTGVVAESLADGEISIFKSGNIVLAAGGVTGLYPFATNPYASKGEAMAMAWRAGAQIENLEFIQFHPTAFQLDGKVISLITEAVRGEGGHLLNDKGSRFMSKYSHLGELAPRDIVARAIYSEMMECESSHVYLDVSHKGINFVEKHFPNLVALTKKYNFDLSRKSVPVSPAAHYTCGGISSDVSGVTSVNGLFAIGEIANCGLHGANRLASNSLLECVVMGMECAKIIKNKDRKSIKSDGFVISRFIKGQISEKILPELKSVLWNCAGIVRNDLGLKNGLDKLQQLYFKNNENIPYAQGIKSQNIYDAARLILLSASARKESRGGHFNSNHRQKNCSPESNLIESDVEINFTRSNLTVHGDIERNVA
ncbi:MAG: L-aspartate oxidase [Limnobacter sp.]|uniref:L-aspartate oxidase n=1 Tax=Limnobacter sp. TaxID=2003368 RepID=UPI0032EB9414